MENYQTLQWQGKVQAKLTGPTADQAWAHLKDFCSLHKWVPTIQTCYKVGGIDGEPGCIRYCAGPVNRSDPTEPVGWSKERLVEYDRNGRSYTYEIVETNKGFGRYVARFEVVPGGDGCLIAWFFAADPIEGWSLVGFVSLLEKLAKGVAERVCEVVSLEESN